MKKLICAVFAALLSFAVPTNAMAATRVMVYYSQNPDTNETNIGWRFQRLADGTFLRDILSTLGTSGAWGGLQITPGSGLAVTINPSPSSQLGAIYQIISDDTTALPPPPQGQSPYQIPIDNTKIVVQALQNAPSGSLGSLNAPGAGGHAIVYLIEAQLGTQDTANQSILFINSSGVPTYNNVNTERQDYITYNVVPGPSTSGDCTSNIPAVPAADNGWIPVAYACVATTATQISNTVCGSGTSSLTCVNMVAGTNFNGSSFATVTFGGAYASNGGATSSTLTTTNNANCNASSGKGLGFSFRNPSGTSNDGTGTTLFFGDLSGDVFICGNAMSFDTTVDSSSATLETMYPAHGTATLVTNASCANGAICQSAAEKDICAHAGAASSAEIIPNGDSVVAIPSAPTSGTGVRVEFYNVSGSSIGSPHTFNFTYQCF